MMLTVARVRAAIVTRPPALVTYNTHTQMKGYMQDVSQQDFDLTLDGYTCTH